MVNDFDTYLHKTQSNIFLDLLFLKVHDTLHNVFYGINFSKHSVIIFVILIVATFRIVHGRQPNDVYFEDKR